MSRPGAAWYVSDGGWHVCRGCDRDFDGRESLMKHLKQSSKHNYCASCDRDFRLFDDQRKHWIESSHHFFCTFCSTHHDDKEALSRHCDREHYRCEACGDYFRTEELRFEHGRESHIFCVEHRRAFKSEANYKAHLASAFHVPRNVPCPTSSSSGCTHTFVSRSAAILHLETGTCTSGLTRAKLDAVVRGVDRSGILITPAARSDNSASPVSPAQAAADAEFDSGRQAYRCPRCASTRFRTRRALEQHLSSPASCSGRQEKLYRCADPACARRFGTLSGLEQHAEVKTCDLRKMVQPQSVMEKVLTKLAR
ncbi:hypothetical protein JCM6882_001262 [Rhodosporidiobolus microsporus]